MTGKRYVPSRMNEGHWYREGAQQVRDNSLNSLMQMDHVIRVDDDGMAWDDVRGVCTPEFYAQVDKEGQYTDTTERDMAEDIKRQGWEPQGGWSGQQGTTSGHYTMHDSEFVGGGLAEHIIGTPGLWVVCEVRTDEDGDDNHVGWAILHKEG